MKLLLKVRLHGRFYTYGIISEDEFIISNEKAYAELDLKNLDTTKEFDYDENIFPEKCLKLITTAFFLQPFAKICADSADFRKNVIENIHKQSKDVDAFLKLILKPPEQEIIDYAWNDRMLHLVWMRAEIDNAFSWLSTLGGAYSALGDYFEECAEEAGRISVRQYRLSKMLGDDGLAARSTLYSALACSQKGQLKLARHIVRSVADFARRTKDRRLLRMCQGVWAKLKYLRSLEKVMPRNDIREDLEPKTDIVL